MGNENEMDGMQKGNIKEGADPKMPVAELDGRISVQRSNAVDVMSNAHVETMSTILSPNEKAIDAIRVHGRGNSVLMSFYPSNPDEAIYKYLASAPKLRKVIRNNIPVWIDTERLSKIQLAGVMAVVDSMKPRVNRVMKIEDGRLMILINKKE